MAQVTLIVTCSGGTYFDRDHYVDIHLPLALACWERYGLESVSAFFPRDPDAVDITIGISWFRDVEALHAAFASSETAAVMADVPRFTDATVSRAVSTPL